jgi:hypothetical protein
MWTGLPLLRPALVGEVMLSVPLQWLLLGATTGLTLVFIHELEILLNIQPKNETVGRVVFDPSNAGGSTAVNDMLPSPPCHMPRVQHAAAAMSRRGLGWRADDSDAFLLHPLQPESTPHCAYRDEGGQMCALKHMGLGFTNAPAVQQDSMVASLRAYRRRLLLSSACKCASNSGARPRARCQCRVRRAAASPPALPQSLPRSSGWAPVSFCRHPV